MPTPAPQQDVIEYSRLPKAIRLGQSGISLTLGCLVCGGAIVAVADWFVPGVKGNGVPQWLWPVLVAIWTPGVLGLLLSFYSIARYPYLSMATGGGQRIISSRTWIWTFLGAIFCVLATLMMIGTIATWETTGEFVALAYLSLTMFFAGFLMAAYRREKHVTIATFLELTFGIGVVLFPIYLPAIVLGSVRCRRFLESLDSDAYADQEVDAARP